MWIRVTAGLSWVIALSYCAPKVTDLASVEEKCPEIHSDQRGSFMVALPSNEIVNVQVDSRFSDDEKLAISQAANRWNEFSQQTRGRPVFSTHSIDLSEPQVTEAQKDACQIASGNETVFSIIRIDSEEKWKTLELKGNMPAVTLRCHTDTKLIKQVVFMNKIYLENDQFFSVALHELGHAIGLNHSCGFDQNTKNYRSCAGLNLEHPYRVAALFPILEAQEKKEKLMSNDKERTRCLFSLAP